MKLKNVLLLIFLVSLAFVGSIWAQKGKDTELQTILQQKARQDAQEKLHLHLDKPYYAVGDDIWFKAYVINANTETLSDISKVLYVELIAPNDSVAKSLKLPIRSGLAWGDFKLTDSLREGNYRLRAYTQWMRNVGPEIFFDKTIVIGNSWSNNIFTDATTQMKSAGSQKLLSSTIKFSNEKKIPYIGAKVKYEIWLGNRVVERGRKETGSSGEIQIDITDRQLDLFTGNIVVDITTPDKQTFRKEIPLIQPFREIDVQFLPEGGLFVKGLLNRIGIKATNNLGRGEAAKGTVTDTQGNQILTFETNSLGTGSFFITPSANDSYTANITFADGRKKSVALPAAQKTGTVISVNSTNSENLLAKIYFSDDLLNTGNYHLIAQRNGNVFFSISINSDKQIIPITVPKKELSLGIVQLTLLSEDLNPLNERIVFIRPSIENLDLSISGLSSSYSKKGKTDIPIYSTANGVAVQGSFSLSVTNTSAVEPDPENETNILTSLLLTPQLNGYIERPNYYFLGSWPERQVELDNLLLTQGWRKIEWKKLLATDVNSKKYEAQKGIDFSGTAYRSGNPMQNGKITIMSVDSNFVTGSATTDSMGRFRFDGLQFENNLRFVVQARTQEDRKAVEIKIDSVLSQPVTANRNMADLQVNVNQKMAVYLEQSEKLFEIEIKNGLRKKPIMLKQVEIIAEKKPEVTFSSNLNGAGKAEKIFTRNDLKDVNTNNLADFLIGRAGVVMIRGQAYIHGSRTAMTVMIDGVYPSSSPVDLGNILPQDVESIEILKSPSSLAIYGSKGANGIIVITTRRGGVVETKPPGIINYTLQGYSPTRIFYSPKYDINPTDKPDLRTTVFWEPNLITDKEGNAKISYFNTDVPGVYRIVIEGIDVNGSLARKVLTYEVK
jgi:TonB-dependent SusC/RagA subfamily outer membrane receptor